MSALSPRGLEGRRKTPAIVEPGFEQSPECAFPCFICTITEHGSCCYLRLLMNKSQCRKGRPFVHDHMVEKQGWASNPALVRLRRVFLSTNSPAPHVKSTWGWGCRQQVKMVAHDAMGRRKERQIWMEKLDKVA